MLRKLSKELVGKRPETMRIKDYYNILERIEYKIKEAIIITVLGIAMVVALIICFTHNISNYTSI